MKVIKEGVNAQGDKLRVVQYDVAIFVVEVFYFDELWMNVADATTKEGIMNKYKGFGGK